MKVIQVGEAARELLRMLQSMDGEFGAGSVEPEDVISRARDLFESTLARNAVGG